MDETWKRYAKWKKLDTKYLALHIDISSYKYCPE